MVEGRQWIGGMWVPGQAEMWQRNSPADESCVWQGNLAGQTQADAAIQAANQAFKTWSELRLEDRIQTCKRFAEIVNTGQEVLANLIAVEIGKPLWEARTEVKAVCAKVANSIEAILSRRWTTTQEVGEYLAVTRFRPHGALFVIGPFNLPAHLPGAHIVPALLAGNTIVFKPSEKAPAVGQWLAQAWEQAGLPPGVLNLLHCSAAVAEYVTQHADIAGVLFTGSQRVGTAIHRGLAGRPDKLLALEMGGNNPLVIHGTSGIRGASITTILSAFITSGQRCTCARRLIVVGEVELQKILEELSRLLGQVRIGLPLDDRQPFMGPLVDRTAADQLLHAQAQLIEQGAETIVAMERDERSPALVSPGVLRIRNDLEIEDTEHFGPLLIAMHAEDFEQAIELAGQTRFGLSAGFIGDRVEDFHYFLHRTRAGIINWNRQTTGAIGKLPFGGIGMSGNHRPSGYFAADYCSYPVASLESHDLNEAQKPLPGLEFDEGR